MLPDEDLQTLARESALPSAALIRRTPKIHMPAVEDELRARGYHTSLVDRGGACLYRCGDGPIGSVALATYSTPLFDSTKPLIWRWHLDRRLVKTPVRAYSELGLDVPHGRWRRPYWQPAAGQNDQLEFSCLPSELAHIAGWLAFWIDARDRGVPHPDPPVPMSRGGVVKSYAWTRDGELAIDAWQRAEKVRQQARQQARELARERAESLRQQHRRELAQAERAPPSTPFARPALRLIIGGRS